MKDLKFFNYKRLDLIVKYLYAANILKDKINNSAIEQIRSLYIRHIGMRTGGLEPLNPYSSNSKNSIMDYEKKFEELFIDLRTNGFNPEHPIPIDADGCLKDGAHRLAASLALGIKPEVISVDKGLEWNFSWFENNGFSLEDKMVILKGFTDLNPLNFSILIVWHPAFRHLEQIKKIIELQLNIAGLIELNFEDNYIAFTNIILDIYQTDCSSGESFQTIFNKIKMLQFSKLCFKVFVLTDQNRNNKSDIHATTFELKKTIRTLLDCELPENAFATLHSSDSLAEARHLSKTLLSVNNIKHLKMRLSYLYDSEFLNWCQDLKQICKKEKINIDDICIVGSAPLQVLGIKQVSDIDFIIKSNYREKYGNTPYHLSEKIDIAAQNYHRANELNDFIPDDILIDNENYHFIFHGLKFANLQIIKDRKQKSFREKDMNQVRQIELFENYSGIFEQERIFKSRVEKELKRRSKKFSNKFRYYRYKILAQIFRGKKQKRYEEKYQYYKKMLQR